MKKIIKAFLITFSILFIFFLVSFILKEDRADLAKKKQDENSVSSNLQSRANTVITVEVLNACGVQGLATEFTNYLRNQKFDVVNVGDYKEGFDIDRTLVIDRTSLNCFNAKKIAEALGIKESQVVPQLDESLQLMVTVLIGKDYKNLKVYNVIQ